MKLYREVKASERLPNNRGAYFVKVKNPEGSMMVFENHDIYMWLDGPTEPQRELWLNTFDVWLEPIEITEEELTEILYNNSGGEWENMGYTMLDELRVEPTIEAILSKLKGE